MFPDIQWENNKLALFLYVKRRKEKEKSKLVKYRNKSYFFLSVKIYDSNVYVVVVLPDKNNHGHKIKPDGQIFKTYFDFIISKKKKKHKHLYDSNEQTNILNPF